MTGEIVFRKARRTDLPAIIELLADDPINGHRERPRESLPPRYSMHSKRLVRTTPMCWWWANWPVQSWPLLRSHSFHILLTRVVSTRSSKRSVLRRNCVPVEFGEKLMTHLAALAEDRSCVSIGLTTSSPPIDAQRFYAGIGFKDTHIGFKRNLR